MKYSVGLLTTVTLMAALVLSACESSSRKMDKAETSVIEANRDLEIAKSEVQAELNIYRAEYADRNIEFNRTISEIKQKIENESDLEIKEQLGKKLDKLEATHRDLRREMNNFQATGKENWNDFKDSFSNRVDDLGSSLKNFFST